MTTLAKPIQNIILNLYINLLIDTSVEELYENTFNNDFIDRVNFLDFPFFPLFIKDRISDKLISMWEKDMVKLGLFS